jgi:hypothetical protein
LPSPSDLTFEVNQTTWYSTLRGGKEGQSSQKTSPITGHWQLPWLNAAAPPPA